MDDRDVLLIERYIHENFQDATDDSYDAYSRWAANEILERVIFEAMKLPPHITGIESPTIFEILELFIDETDYYAYIASSDTGRDIFSAAREEAKLVLCYIQAHR